MKKIEIKLISLIIFCSGSSVLASQSFQLEGQDAMNLTQTLVDIEALESNTTSNGFSISTDRFVCRMLTEKQSGDPSSKAEELPIDANCKITQTYTAIDATKKINSNTVKKFTQTQEIGNSLEIFNLLAKSGAQYRGKTISIKSLNCEITGEFQSGDPQAQSEFLPTSANCLIEQ